MDQLRANQHIASKTKKVWTQTEAKEMKMSQNQETFVPKNKSYFMSTHN